jgi:hypothetical protein
MTTRTPTKGVAFDTAKFQAITQINYIISTLDMNILS